MRTQPKTIAANDASLNVSLLMSGNATKTGMPTATISPSIAMKPAIIRSRNKLFPSVLYSDHGSETAPRFFTMPSSSINFPRLESQFTSKAMTISNVNEPIAMPTTNPMFDSTHCFAVSKSKSCRLLEFDQFEPLLLPAPSPH